MNNSPEQIIKVINKTMTGKFHFEGNVYVKDIDVFVMVRVTANISEVTFNDGYYWFHVNSYKGESLNTRYSQWTPLYNDKFFINIIIKKVRTYFGKLPIKFKFIKS